MRENKETDARCNDFANEWQDNIVPGFFNESNTDIKNLMKRCEEYQSLDYRYKSDIKESGRNVVLFSDSF
jgi:hypothetical protein